MMAENMMNSAHKATNEAYRTNYDRIFGGKDEKDTDSVRPVPEGQADSCNK